LLCIAILGLTALAPLAVAIAVLWGPGWIGFAGFAVFIIGALWVARASGYEPSGWQSRDIGALSDRNLQRVSDAAGWPTRLIVRVRWAAGVLVVVALIGYYAAA
jgi:hypothetical protein